MNKHIILQNSIMVAIDGNPFVVHSGNPNFEIIKAKLLVGDYNISHLIDASSVIKEFSNSVIDVKNGLVFYNEKPLKNNITNRILAMYQEGEDFSYLEKFLKRCAENPDPDILDEIDGFLAGVYIPIGKDGCLYAYKTVTTDYMDIYTKKIDNSIGSVVKEDRSLISTDRNQGCAKGLHCGNIEYVRKYNGWNGSGNRLVIVRVDPKNIVSVPKDESFMKIRCCEYKVVCEVTWDFLLNMNIQDGFDGEHVISVDIDEGKNNKPEDVLEDCPVVTVEPLTDNFSNKWSNKEDDILYSMKDSGHAWCDIAVVVGRSAEACRRRYRRMVYQK